MAEIRVEDLQKRFGEFVAVKRSSFTVADGEFVVLLGPSGCGKTTTLRMIAGLELPTSGRILLGGDDVTFHRAGERDIAFVFQLFALYPHMNVRQNIAFPLKCQGMSRSEVARRVAEAGRILRIEHILDKPVSGLSGGDRQRVALGRAIVREPKCFLMDEPLGALDSEFRHVMCGELRGLHDRLKATTVYVTHDQLEAMSMADKIAVMNKGVIEQYATPQEIYQRPVSMFVADFIGSPSMNFLRFQSALAPGDDVVSLGEARIGIPAIREAVPAAELALGVRPEHIRFDDGSSLRGEVYGTEYLGTTQIVTVDTAFGQVKARTGSDIRVADGSHVGLSFDAARLSLFRASDGGCIRSALYEGSTHG
ncbi:carbohydrate ABC transporter ATP-binding protein (CUT1 family) [Dongia mobilis]|uniref:Carbohydrate ABC transporter ATP-binding protein (CUT1 family) n=1 Tax=Dongia mobilis TaxID=578943 RepID=A0A4R6WGV5_9PROT|nr:ABC transporter ATP-binding protein [Dongia mobilis]TDQ77660.1 carbohydrate ABC transporter ATP-binding protein (CUT1 family) [Dongia mobilis]